MSLILLIVQLILVSGWYIYVAVNGNKTRQYTKTTVNELRELNASIRDLIHCVNTNRSTAHKDARELLQHLDELSFELVEEVEEIDPWGPSHI